MSKTGWFGSDEDGRVVSKTEIDHSDGTVHKYPYTEADNIHAGHGHERWDSLDSYMNDNSNPDRTYRSTDDPRSINRRWRGDGYDLALDVLNDLSLEELELLLSPSKNYVHTSEEMLVKGMHKQLILKK